MDTTKLKQEIAQAEEQAAKYRRLADDLKAALKRFSNGAGGEPAVHKPEFKLNIKSKAEPKSALLTAVDVLVEEGKPVHIKDLVDMVSKRRGMLTPRASIESVLVRAIKDEKFGLKRTAPGTFAVET